MAICFKMTKDRLSSHSMGSHSWSERHKASRSGLAPEAKMFISPPFISAAVERVAAFLVMPYFQYSPSGPSFW